jgi:hypothetical protein
VIVKETKDIDLIKKILLEPEIYDRISDDLCPPVDKFEPPLNVVYLAGFVDAEIIGLMIYDYVNEQLKCHLQVLKKYRAYANQFARMAFGEVKNASIIAEIPTCYPEVIRFAQELGFNQVGKIEKARLKHGSWYDLNIMRRENGICI